MEGKRAGEERGGRGKSAAIRFSPKVLATFLWRTPPPFLSLSSTLFLLPPFLPSFCKRKKGDKGDFYLPPPFPLVSPVPSSPNGGISRCPPGCYEGGEAMGENLYPTQAAFSLSPLSILAGRHANGALHSGERRGKRRAKKSFWRKTT